MQGGRASARPPAHAPRHGPRPIDVDVLLLGELELSSPRLRLPHAEITARKFVLIPLLELDADFDPLPYVSFRPTAPARAVELLI